MYIMANSNFIKSKAYKTNQMKKIITLCLLFFALTTQAKNSISDPLINGTITGKVLDATLNEPLPYVTIVIKSEAGEIINGSITDDNGKFIVSKIPAGKYIVSIQFIKDYRYKRRIINNKYKSYNDKYNKLINQ